MDLHHNKSKDLRTEILDVARALLLSEGYSGLSMRKIARQLGRSPASLYLYFGGKDKLFQALVEEGMEKLYRALDMAITREAEDAVAQLEAFCLAYIEFGLSEPEFYEIMFMTRPHMKEGDSSSRYGSDRHISLLTLTITDGNRQGHFHAPDPALTARVVWGLLHGITSLSLAQHLNARVEAETLTRFGIAMMLQAFTRKE